MGQNNFDVIIVGAGPGGCSAAKTAAEKKLKVLLLERARTPGDKNMSGSLFFKPIAEEVFPGISDQYFVKCHPLGGTVNIAGCGNDGTWMGISSNVGSEIGSKMLLIFRNESDKWLSEQAQKAGAHLKTACVRDLIIENGCVKGVIVDDGERIEAPLTIGADGLHSIVARRSGLGKKHTNTSSKITLAIKYVFKLPPEVLSERVVAEDSDTVELGTVYNGLEPIEWCAHLLPSPQRGIAVATIYHHVSEMAVAKVNIHQRMKWFLTLPECRKILKGAEFSYFNSHCLSWLEWEGYAKKTYMPGLMLVGCAAGLSNPFDGFGANVAMATGKMAAEVAAEAKSRKDYSEEVLAEYEKKWRESFVGQDEEMTTNLSHFMMNDFRKVFAAFEGMVRRTMDAKLSNVSFPEMYGKELGAMLTIIPALTKAFPLLSPVLQPYVSLASSLMEGGE